jgi:hypothetical protein
VTDREVIVSKSLEGFQKNQRKEKILKENKNYNFFDFFENSFF